MERTLAGAASTLLALSFALGCGQHGASRSGPLAAPPVATSIGVPVALGRPFSDGLLVAKNNGKKAAVLDRASFVRPDAWLKYLGAYVLSQPLRCQKVRRIPAPHACLFYTWKDRRGHLQSSQRTTPGFVADFRVPHDGHVLKGFTVASGHEVVVVLGRQGDNTGPPSLPGARTQLPRRRLIISGHLRVVWTALRAEEEIPGQLQIAGALSTRVTFPHAGPADGACRAVVVSRLV